MIYLVLLSVPAAVLAWYLGSKFRDHWKQQRRRRLQAAPFPDAWRELLWQQFALYRKLPDRERRTLERHMQVFMAEKVFVGCNGMEINEHVKLLIAAQACILILNKATDYYPGFATILVYPETFVVPMTQRDGMVHSDVVSVRTGESWHRGPVVLAWDQVLQGARNDRDGHNVVMHEFAHKLDEENWQMDGLPILSDPQQYGPWKQVLTDAYQQLHRAMELDQPDVIDDYGATSPAEFFAVVTETFFEKPQQLQQQHPQLYDQFKRYYGSDPVHWVLRES
ncbi:MAG: M90 family metallopeptidase [Pseudomonadota bacterium]|nr:M90 family metallopeptidase [Pseudomonadota bacterium]